MEDTTENANANDKTQMLVAVVAILIAIIGILAFVMFEDLKDDSETDDRTVEEVMSYTDEVYRVDAEYDWLSLSQYEQDVLCETWLAVGQDRDRMMDVMMLTYDIVDHRQFDAGVEILRRVC